VKYTLYVPGVVGAVIENVSDTVPLVLLWSLVSTQVLLPELLVAIFHPVAFQVLLPPLPAVLNATSIVVWIIAPGATVIAAAEPAVV
jgi:hypothetical protein